MSGMRNSRGKEDSFETATVAPEKKGWERIFQRGDAAAEWVRSWRKD